MDVTFIERMLNNFGLPILALIAVFVGVWRVLVWLAPRADRLINSHVTFVTEVGNTQKQIVITQQEIANSLNSQDRNLQTMLTHITKERQWPDERNHSP